MQKKVLFFLFGLLGTAMQAQEGEEVKEPEVASVSHSPSEGQLLPSQEAQLPASQAGEGIVVAPSEAETGGPSLPAQQRRSAEQEKGSQVVLALRIEYALNEAARNRPGALRRISPEDLEMYFRVPDNMLNAISSEVLDESMTPDQQAAFNRALTADIGAMTPLETGAFNQTIAENVKSQNSAPLVSRIATSLADTGLRLLKTATTLNDSLLSKLSSILDTIIAIVTFPIAASQASYQGDSGPGGHGPGGIDISYLPELLSDFQTSIGAKPVFRQTPEARKLKEALRRARIAVAGKLAFDFLGIPDTSSPDQIREAYAQLRSRLMRQEKVSKEEIKAAYAEGNAALEYARIFPPGRVGLTS